MPYEMITRYDSLHIKPENGKFFLPHQFYSTSKDYVMTDEKYENVKKFYQTMKLENLGELNKIYNFQDTMICVKYLSNVLFIYKIFLNLILESVILQVLLAVVFIKTKANAVLPYLQTLNMSEFLKRH